MSENKRILYLTSYYEPEIAASMYIFNNIRENLCENGYQVIVIAPTPTRGISKDVRRIYKKKKNEIKLNGNLQIIRFNLFRESKNSILRLIRYMIAHIKHYCLGRKVKNIDLIIVSSTPPTQPIMASILKKNKKVPMVYLLQDIFPKSLNNLGLSSNKGLLWKIGLKVEEKAYKNADKIIGISEDFRKHLLSRGVETEKIEIIYNWVEQDNVYYIPREKNDIFDKYSLDRGKFYLSYSGNIGLSQNFDIMLNAAKELKNIEDICFIVIGDGAYKDTLLDEIERSHLNNIKHIPFQDYTDIAKVFSVSDIGLVLSKANIGSNSVPSKTWSIMSAERPVLASFDLNTELNNIICSNNIGYCVNPDDYEGFISKIMYLYNNRSEIEKLGTNGRKYILNNLTREIGTLKYLNVVNELLNKE